MKREFSAEEIGRISRVRGYLHAIDTFDASRTGLIIIDMQNFFLTPNTPIEVPSARTIVPAINRMAASLRSAGGTVVWVQQIYEDHDHAGYALNCKIFGKSAADFARSALKEGEPGFALWPVLEPRPTDLRIRKTRYSAFIEGSSQLHTVLQKRGIDTLLIAGTVTNTCCECTARDGMMLNYNVIMLADALAANDEDEHWMTLRNFARCFGDVYTVSEVEALLLRA